MCVVCACDSPVPVLSCAWVQARYGDAAARQLQERKEREAAQAAQLGADANLVPLGTRVRGWLAGWLAGCLSGGGGGGRAGFLRIDVTRHSLRQARGAHPPCCVHPAPAPRLLNPTLQVIAAPAEPEEPLPTVEWWDARILAAKTYGGVIDGQPAQVRVGGHLDRRSGRASVYCSCGSALCSDVWLTLRCLPRACSCGKGA